MNLRYAKQLLRSNQTSSVILAVTLLICVVGFLFYPDISAAGIKAMLNMPATSFTAPEPFQPEIGLSASEDSTALLKQDGFKGKITGTYETHSGLLLLDQRYGKFSGVKTPLAVSPTGYRARLLESQSRTMWRESYKLTLRKTADQTGGSLLQFELPFKAPKMIKSILGEGGAGLKINGYRRISFAGTSQWTDEASTAGVKQSKFPSLNMEQTSSFTINGNIGSKIFVDVNQDSKRQQSLSNRLQLRYKGDEDDVVKTVELGNTNLTLPSTRFVGYSQGIQGLFGVKTTAELGGLKLTAIASQEKSSNQSASFLAGAQSQVRVIRDYQYLDNVYFDLTRRDTIRSLADLQAGDSITNLELYYSVNSNNTPNNVVPLLCSLFVDPFNKGYYPDEKVGGTYLMYSEENNRGKFFWHPTQHYLIMDQPITNISLGVYMQYHAIDGDSIVTVGYISRDTVSTLKLIVPSNPRPGYVTWNYVWRNVYSLGSRIDDLDNVEIKIYKGSATDVNNKDAADLDHQDGTSYINLLGLDANNDGQVDSRNDQVLDPYRGHLRFPNRKPFANSALTEKVDTLYNSSLQGERSKNTKYYLMIKSSARQSQLSLNRFDIIANSETVTLNGRPLKKDTDYQISYQTGTITLLNQDAQDPNADVRVAYEYAPLIAAEKKTLLGARGEYQVSSNLKMGTTVLYKSEKTTDRKPRLGEEQSSFLNLDSDISYAFYSNGLTRLFDALPLLETKVPSRISFDGEIGQSMPNPNTAGEAYIDDFESARERFSLGIMRTTWHPASLPDGLDTTGQAGEPVRKKGKLIWYNPYNQVPVSEIYDRQVKAGEDRTHVLVLRFAPQGDSLGENKAASYGGVMKALSSGANDQSKTEFIELRMRGKIGTLHVDLGEITENLTNKAHTSPVTEDRGVSPNGLLDIGEDVGLDGMSDDSERVECQCDDPDPRGDNWDYSNRDDYDHINGTEGNGDDPEAGGRPDTEDRNGNGQLDVKNNYYSFAEDLSRGEHVVPNSERNGWYTVRIPFQDSLLAQKIGNADRSIITGVRIWIDGVDEDTAYVEIANLELTRNVWEVQPILSSITARTTVASLKAAVVNTEENADYFAPPGVAGYYDKTTGLREKEQSLSLSFENLAPGDTAFAQRKSFKPQDLTSYRKLEMWVHGDSTRDSVRFFFRFGNDAKNYYEYHNYIDSGWSTRNSANITFDEITQLKLKLQQEQVDSAGLNETSDGNYRLVGRPSLTQIQYYAIGVINARSDTLLADPSSFESGELWFDELRTSSVRSDRGLAAYVASAVSFGDLGSASATFSKQDAFFRNLTQANRRDLGSGSENTTYSGNVNFALDRFLSPNEKARIPISYNWGKSVLSPRLMTGSDIAVPADMVEDQKNTSVNSSFSISESWAKQTKNLLYTVLLNKFSSSFSYNRSNTWSPTQDGETESYTAKGHYAVNSPLKRGLRLFSWLQGMPLIPKRVLGTEFNPIPLRLTVDGEVNRSWSNSVNSYKVRTTRYLRTFKGRMETGFAPINSLDIGFGMNTDRDLSDPKQLLLSLDPKKSQLGVERTYSQNFTANYAPLILPFITGTKFGFTAAHSENMNQSVTTNTGTRRIDNSKSFTAGASFSLQKLLGQNKHAPKAPTIKSSPKDADKGKDKDKDKGKDKDGKSLPSLDELKGGADSTGVAPIPSGEPGDDKKSTGDSDKDKDKKKDKKDKRDKDKKNNKDNSDNYQEAKDQGKSKGKDKDVGEGADKANDQPIQPQLLGPVNPDLIRGTGKAATDSSKIVTGIQPQLLGPVNPDLIKGSGKAATDSSKIVTGIQPQLLGPVNPDLIRGTGKVATDSSKTVTGIQPPLLGPVNPDLIKDTGKVATDSSKAVTGSQPQLLGPVNPDLIKGTGKVATDSSKAVTGSQPQAADQTNPVATGDSAQVVADSLNRKKINPLMFPGLDSMTNLVDSSGASSKGKSSKPKTPKTSGTPVYMYGLQFIRFFTDRIDPISGSYSWNKRATLDGFTERPGFLYRLGLTDDYGGDSIRVKTGSSANQLDARSRGRTYSLRSGVKLLFDIKINTSWAKSVTEATGKPTRDESETFPDVQFVFGKLDFLILPKLFARSFTLDSKYTRRVTGSVINGTDHDGYTMNRTTSTEYSPLASVRLDWKYLTGLSTTINYSKSVHEKEQFYDPKTYPDKANEHIQRAIDYSNSLTIGSSYSFKGGSKFWLPLFGRIKIQSDMSFKLDIRQGTTRTEDKTDKINPAGITAERTDFSVLPTISYSFSTNIKGGLSGRWQDSDDRRTSKKSHVRELSFWVEIRF